MFYFFSRITEHNQLHLSLIFSLCASKTYTFWSWGPVCELSIKRRRTQFLSSVGEAATSGEQAQTGEIFTGQSANEIPSAPSGVDGADSGDIAQDQNLDLKRRGLEDHIPIQI